MDDYSPVRHHSTVDGQDIINFANNFGFCKVIKKSWSLPRLLAKFPDINSSGRDVMCDFLSGDIIATSHAYFDTFKLTIMTCQLESQTNQAALWSSSHKSPANERSQIVQSWYTDCVSYNPEYYLQTSKAALQDGIREERALSDRYDQGNYKEH
ncbi:hypothetical protein DER45DRAFT_103209 [Fusarium avenaceum]|nr:hypothetical protein DER45DRAFT_103209 [Fusarium avenaceum]